MRAMLFAGLLFLGLDAFAGEWTRVDDATLKFSGIIEVDEYDRFRPLFDGKVRQLIVDSGGGETMAALKIAADLHEANLEVSVEGLCLSSCANYFFSAAARKVIRKGIVGFHGNMKACFSGPRWEERRREMLDSGVPIEVIDAYYPVLQENMKVEENFLKRVGVDQELFDISCTSDKGQGDGKNHSFLLPRPATFERFGFHGVIGIQDQELAQKLPTPPAIW